MGDGDYLLNIKAHLTSNADEFIKDIQRQLRALDQAASRPQTLEAATSQLAQTEGEGVAQLQRLKERRQIDAQQHKERLANLRAEHDLERRLMGQRFGQEVPRAQPQEVLAHAQTAYAAVRPDATEEQYQLAQARMTTSLNRQVRAEETAEKDLKNRNKAVSNTTKKVQGFEVSQDELNKITKESAQHQKRLIAKGKQGEAYKDRTELGHRSEEEVQRLGREAANLDTNRQIIKTQQRQDLTTNQAFLDVKGAAIVATKEYNDATRESAKRIAAATGADKEGATRYQRVQAWAADRQGSPYRPARDYQRLGQAAVSKTMMAASYAAPAALLYGGLSFGANILDEAGDLQQELGLLQGAFEATGDTAQSITFDEYKAELRSLSKETGASLSETANVTRQLAGAYSKPDGTIDTERATKEVKVALQFSEMTGLPLQEITDSLSAISLAYDDSMAQIADTTTKLSTDLGVRSEEIVRFSADIAPLAKELGFTNEQISGLGAVMNKYSGKSGNTLAEQAGRFLPGINTNRVDVLKQFDEAGADDVIEDLNAAYTKQDLPQVLATIVKEWDRLGASQQKALVDSVAGERQAATFYALVRNQGETLRVLDMQADDADGAFAEKWKDHTDTVQYSMKELKRTFEDLGVALIDSGLDDALQGMISTLTLLADVTADVFGAFGKLNKGLDSLPLQLIATTLAMKGIFAIGQKLLALKGLSFLSSLGGRVMDRATGKGPRGYKDPLSADFIGPHTPRQPYVDPATGLIRSGKLGRGIPLSEYDRGTQRAYKTKRLRKRMDFDEFGNIAAGKGTSVTSALADAAPEIAAVLTGVAIERIAAYNAAINKESDAIGDLTKAELEKGVSAEVLRARTEGAFEEGAFDKYAGRIFGGGMSAMDEARYSFEKELEKDEAAKNLAMINAGRAKKGDKNKSLELAYNRQKDSGAAGLGPGEAANWDQISQKERDEWIATSEEMLDRYEKDPTDKDANDWVKNQINAVVEGTDKALYAVYDEAGKLVDSTAAEGKRKLDEAKQLEIDRKERKLSVGEAQTAYDLGELGFDQLKKAMADNIEFLTKALGGTPGSEEWLKNLAELRAAEAYQNDVLLKEVNERYEREARIMGIGAAGDITAAQALSIAARKYKEISAPGAGYTDSQIDSAAQDLITARDEAFQEKVDGAGSALERYRALKEGPDPLDPAVVASVNRGKLSKGSASTMVAALASSQRKGATETDPAKIADGIEQAKNYVVDMINQYGEDNLNVMLMIQLARKAELEALLKNVGLAGSFGATASDELNRELNAVNATIAAIQQVQAEGGTGATLTPDQQAEANKEAERKAKLEADIETAKADYNLKRSETDDPVADARLTLAEAKEARRRIQKGDDNGYKDATAAINEAQFALNDALKDRAKRLRDAQFDMARALADGDPVKLAFIDIAAARAAYRDAKDEPERLAAAAAEVSAGFALKHAQEGVVAAKKGYAGAVAARGGNTVEEARIAMEIADDAVRASADGTADRWNALSARLSADRTMRDALLEVFAAQRDVAAAMFEAAGNVVGVAEVQLANATDKYNALANAGVGGPELDRAQAEVIRAQTNLTNVKRDDKLGDLAYLYEFDKITVQQYIAGLQAALQSIPESDKERRRGILQQIKSLRDEMNQDLGFNLPSNLKLPTLYEARRLGQSGPGGYQDNRTVTITLNATNAIDGAAAVEAVVKAVEGPPRVGVASRLY